MVTGKCCPGCRSSAVRERKKGSKNQKLWVCYTCGAEFDEADTREFKGYWSGKKDCKRKTKSLEIMNRRELLYKISSIESGQYTKRDRALIAFAYITGGRIEEIVGQKRGSAWRVKPICKFQIEEKELNGTKFIVIFHVGILKKKDKQIIYRNIPIHYEKEKEFISIINDYVNGLEENEPLFDFTRRRAWQIVNKKIGLFPHYFRHLRTTHLVENYGFDSNYLKEYHGWANSKPADTYIHLNWEKAANKMR